MISALECSRFGWICSNVNELSCVVCGVSVYFRSSPELDKRAGLTKIDVLVGNSNLKTILSKKRAIPYLRERGIRWRSLSNLTAPVRNLSENRLVSVDLKRCATVVFLTKMFDFCSFAVFDLLFWSVDACRLVFSSLLKTQVACALPVFLAFFFRVFLTHWLICQVSSAHIGLLLVCAKGCQRHGPALKQSPFWRCTSRSKYHCITAHFDNQTRTGKVAAASPFVASEVRKTFPIAITPYFFGRIWKINYQYRVNDPLSCFHLVNFLVKKMLTSFIKTSHEICFLPFVKNSVP